MRQGTDHFGQGMYYGFTTKTRRTRRSRNFGNLAWRFHHTPREAPQYLLRGFLRVVRFVSSWWNPWHTRHSPASPDHLRPRSPPIPRRPETNRGPTPGSRIATASRRTLPTGNPATRETPITVASAIGSPTRSSRKVTLEAPVLRAPLRGVRHPGLLLQPLEQRQRGLFRGIGPYKPARPVFRGRLDPVGPRAWSDCVSVHALIMTRRAQDSTRWCATRH